MSSHIFLQEYYNTLVKTQNITIKTNTLFNKKNKSTQTKWQPTPPPTSPPDKPSILQKIRKLKQNLK